MCTSSDAPPFLQLLRCAVVCTLADMCAHATGLEPAHSLTCATPGVGWDCAWPGGAQRVANATRRSAVQGTWRPISRITCSKVRAIAAVGHACAVHVVAHSGPWQAIPQAGHSRGATHSGSRGAAVHMHGHATRQFGWPSLPRSAHDCGTCKRGFQVHVAPSLGSSASLQVAAMILMQCTVLASDTGCLQDSNGHASPQST